MPVADFSVDPKSIKYLTTSRGVAFTADLLFNGDKVGMVENRGIGGATTADISIGDNLPSIRDALKEAWSSNSEKFWAEEAFLDHLMDLAEEISTDS